MIYLDNAATSFPKPPEVGRALGGVTQKLGGNPGRGGHRGALAGGRIVENCREKIARLVGGDASRVAFTLGCTDSLNMAIMGMLRQGDEVLVSHAEHNAVMRPLEFLKKQGHITYRILPPDGDGRIDPDEITRNVRPDTMLCILCHASNVTGVVQPAREIALKCHSLGIPLVLDAAQTAGHEDLTRIPADVIALPGHKGLLGPMGVGALYVSRDADVRPFRRGGTGSLSESWDQPDMYPDRLESGTPNLPGIAGLLQGVRFVERHLSAIAQYEQHLLHVLWDGLAALPGVTLYGPGLHVPREAVVAFNVGDMDSGQAADALDRMGFAVRGGLHCAPGAHKFLGTLNRGAVRASIGPYNTQTEIEEFVKAVASLVKHT